MDTLATADPDASVGAPTADAIEPQSKVCWSGGKVVLSEWRVELLAAIGETGSLAQAAERLDVPYRTALSKLEEVEERLGVKLLETQSSGAAEGGGSQMTPAARDLIERFRPVAGGVAALVDKRFRAELADLLG